MATKQEIEAQIAKKLEDSYEAEVAGPNGGQYVRDAIVPTITISDWNSIATWLHSRQFDQIGRHLAQKVLVKIRSDAQSEAQQMLSDDALSLTEYARINGL